MNCLKNTELLPIVDEILACDLKISRGWNKKLEIRRLIFEILRRYNFSRKDFLALKGIQDYMSTGQFNYHFLKKVLIRLRYPEAYKNEALKEKNIYLPALKELPSKKAYKFSGKFYPEKIYIEKSLLKNKIVGSVLEKFSNIKPVIIEKLKSVKIPVKKYIHTLGKNELFLVKENFDIFKHCPCTKNVFVCDYYILNIGFGCVYDCTYCYLQHYTNFPGIILPVNIEKILEKLESILVKSRKILRIGTGEFTDSLAFEDVIPYSEYLIPFFKNQKHILELKTKSVNITNILKIESSPNVVISWSLNTRTCIKKEEYYTPGLKERLNAAREVAKKGFPVGFHFDPIIYYDNWEQEYKETIELMFDYVKGNIEWISLGALRFHRSLKQIIEKRFPQPGLLNGELLIDPVDNKMRYPEKIRIDLFKKMVKWIRHFDKNTIVYLCMEPKYIWKEVFNKLSYKTQRNKGINYL